MSATSLLADKILGLRQGIVRDPASRGQNTLIAPGVDRATASRGQDSRKAPRIVSDTASN
ncbi:hypothetical protein QMK38_19915 [Lysinibacillus fusiformis]|nr:hypothetical protein [Lysinibacillus fusiformis]